MIIIIAAMATTGKAIFPTTAIGLITSRKNISSTYFFLNKITARTIIATTAIAAPILLGSEISAVGIFTVGGETTSSKNIIILLYMVYKINNPTVKLTPLQTRLYFTLVFLSLVYRKHRRYSAMSTRHSRIATVIQYSRVEPEKSKRR